MAKFNQDPVYQRRRRIAGAFVAAAIAIPTGAILSHNENPIPKQRAAAVHNLSTVLGEVVTLDPEAALRSTPAIDNGGPESSDTPGPSNFVARVKPGERIVVANPLRGSNPDWISFTYGDKTVDSLAGRIAETVFVDLASDVQYGYAQVATLGTGQSYDVRVAKDGATVPLDFGVDVKRIADAGQSLILSSSKARAMVSELVREGSQVNS